MFDDLVNIADKLGFLQAVKGKLVTQPDPAADKLVTALEEISKIYGAIEAELVRYLSVSFDASQTAGERNRERAHLVELEGGEVTARMGKARGHCAKIMNIYHNYLSPWFAKILSSAESGNMSSLFGAMDKWDGYMLDAIDELAKWLSEEAAETLELVDDGKFDEANQRIKKARKEVLTQRRTIADAMRSLLDIQAEFMGASGAV